MNTDENVTAVNMWIAMGNLNGVIISLNSLFFIYQQHYLLYTSISELFLGTL